ncbi:hypothetical protein GCM10008171_34870 [Methylopila jiangsuensis]|uniref:RNA-binding S4 domain-containing protein n=1 Tax=Methylopila jiangsuensis TaxID=586230 RepID=A0A9W6JMK3_9HYPH|nr:RNA-binding S4 domain-containing protein [Methylopila jiangsuensis]MDR6284382.1 ribosome-associated heat shock protein Hsp15 [Methylopila jiangsuensis]GLK78233.1 hypothetical protein GCM10008171_34870 [Methylopila jiangsuensis]
MAAARPEEASPDRARLDVWLWRARVVKTRALAARLAESGHVRVNGRRTTAPGRGVRTGDVLTIALESTVRVLRVADLGARRGPPSEARGLFVELGAAAPLN